MGGSAKLHLSSKLFNRKIERAPFEYALLQEAHRILLSGVRGERKQHGDVRISQNWIGGTNIQTAAFIPPHPEDLPELLKDLEYFWHNKGLNMPNLIKIVVSHYQFDPSNKSPNREFINFCNI